VLAALIAKYRGLDGANATYAGELSAALTRLDSEMTERVASLHLEMVKRYGQEEADRAAAVGEAKQALSMLGTILEKTKPLVKAADLGKKVRDATKIEDVAVGRGLDRGGDPLNPLAPDAPVPKNYLESNFESDTSFGAKGLDTAFAAYEKGSGLISVFTSGDKVAEGLTAMTKEGASGVTQAKAGVDIASAVLTPVKETGTLVLEGVAKAYDAYAGRQMVLFQGQFLGVEMARDIAARATALRTIASKLGEIDKITGALGVISGGLSIAEGVQTNDADAALTGGVEVVEGSLSLALPSIVGAVEAAAMAPGIAIGGLQVKGMIYVLSQMSQALQAIRNASIKEAIKDMVDDLAKAGVAASTFDEGLGQWASRQGAADPVEAQLGAEFGKRALRQVAPMRAALAAALSSPLQGRLSKRQLYADTFASAFGGRDLLQATFLQLGEPGADTTGGLVAEAEAMKDVIANTKSGASDLVVTLEAMQRDTKFKLWGVERNTLKVKSLVTAGSGRVTSIGHYVGKGFELATAIDDATYRDWLAAKLQGKTLGALHGVGITIEADVNGTTVTLEGSEGSLHASDGVTAEVAAALTQEGDEDPGDPAAVLWRSHMRSIRVPDATGIQAG
jgi:hypothetical protein